jgi:trk system potassium uptake protein TrkA
MVIGGGKVGSNLGELLRASGHQVQIIERRREVISGLEAQLGEGVVVYGDGTDPNLLESRGMRQADVVAAVTGSDETNLVVTSLARLEFNTPRTIARVNHPRNAWMFTPAMGVDVALDQSSLMAHLIAEEMSLGDMLTLLKLRKGEYALVEERLDPRSRAVGRAVRAIEWPLGCALTAVIRGGRLHMPQADLVLEAGDEILALVHSAEAGRLAALLEPQAVSNTAPDA